MHVAGGPTESPWPKNVGLLFFHEAPERFFPGVQIDVVWFPPEFDTNCAKYLIHIDRGMAPATTAASTGRVWCREWVS